MKQCTECGAKNTNSAKICNDCGSEIKKNSEKIKIPLTKEKEESLITPLIPLTKEKKELELKAKEFEKHLDYDEAINIWKKIKKPKEAARVRKMKAEQGAIKVDQTVVHGDQVTKTEIKDSVVNKSNIGSGGDDKLTKIKELKELLSEGLIDDDEFKQMKKEILGK